MAGKCTLSEIKTTLSLDDVLFLNEIVAVEAAQERRAHERAERDAKRGI